jgi:hypothetical protein
MFAKLRCASPTTVAAALLFPAARIAGATGGLPPPSRPDDAEHGEKKGRCHNCGDNDSLGRRGLTCAHEATAGAAAPASRPIW